MAMLAIAAYSHELSLWYPLSDAQMQRAFQLSDQFTRHWESRSFVARFASAVRDNFDRDTNRMAPNEERLFEETSAASSRSGTLPIDLDPAAPVASDNQVSVADLEVARQRANFGDSD